MSTSTCAPLDLVSPRLSPRSWKYHPGLLHLVAAGPVIWWFCKRLNDGSDEPLGLLTLALALGLAWRDRASLHAGRAARICGAALLLLSVLGVHGMPPMIRAGLAVGGIAMCRGMHLRAGLIGLLILSLPLAASMQFFLGYPLRVAAAEGAVRLLELGSLVVSRVGTQIDLGGQVVGVDPACGGVRMLWHALAAAMALAAIHRLTWRATIVSGVLAIVLVIPANTLRAAVLAVKETGHWSSFSAGHEALGLLSFGMILVPLWIAISSRSRPVSPSTSGSPANLAEKILLVSAAIISPVLALSTPRTPEFPIAGPAPVSFTFTGLTLPLVPLPATNTELAFAKSFPGTLNSYSWGDGQVILRRVNEATRRLHPSRDCLRAAGFDTTEALTVSHGDGSVWARFHATRNGEQWTVHERITSGGNGHSWTDVSAWYWSALWHPLNGPWQAETVISKSL